MKKLFRIVKKFVFLISFLALILAVAVAFSSKFAIPGGFRVYSVLSGSMQPAVPTGSLIISKIPKESKDIQKEQIITFEQPGFENKFITHRVYQVLDKNEARFFATKGDANNQPDSWLISYGRVKGIYQNHLPYLGYILEFIRSPFGIILFVIIPVAILVLEELKNIGATLLELKLQKEKLTEKESLPVGKKKKFTLGSKELASIIFFLFCFFTVDGSYALLSSVPVQVSGISLTTGVWENPGDVVINEVMWMGSTQSPSDEWIELRNTTGNSIDLSGWTIEGAGSGSSAVTLSGTIPVDGYFLISNYSQTASAISDTISVNQVNSSISLNNDGEKLILKNAAGGIIDETPSTAWPAGYFDGTASGLHQSMERNDDPSTGWHTCTDSACNETTYWDSEENNYGTPKADNLSENDPSFLDISITPAPTATPSLIPPTSLFSTPTDAPLPTSTPAVSLNPQKEPTLDFFLRSDKKAVGFKVGNVADFESLSYEISYETNNGIKGMMGEIEIKNQETIIREDLLLGTCSAVEGVVCIYDTGIKTIHLKVTLKDSLQEKILEKEINYD